MGKAGRVYDVFAVTEGHICQRSLGGPCVENLSKRTFCRFEICDGVFEVAGNFVSVASRAGRGVGFASSRNDQLIGCPSVFR